MTCKYNLAGRSNFQYVIKKERFSSLWFGIKIWRKIKMHKFAYFCINYKKIHKIFSLLVDRCFCLFLCWLLRKFNLTFNLLREYLVRKKYKWDADLSWTDIVNKDSGILFVNTYFYHKLSIYIFYLTCFLFHNIYFLGFFYHFVDVVKNKVSNQRMTFNVYCLFMLLWIWKNVKVSKSSV